jgi:hypothetical protein
LMRLSASCSHSLSVSKAPTTCWRLLRMIAWRWKPRIGRNVFDSGGREYLLMSLSALPGFHANAFAIVTRFMCCGNCDCAIFRAVAYVLRKAIAGTRNSARRRCMTCLFTGKSRKMRGHQSGQRRCFRHRERGRGQLFSLSKRGVRVKSRCKCIYEIPS